MKYLIIITVIIIAIIIVIRNREEKRIDTWTWDGQFVHQTVNKNGYKTYYTFRCKDFEQAKRIMKDSYYVGNYKK